eukprot:g27713.t1
MLLVSLQKPTELSESEATDFEEQKLCRRPVVPAFIYRVLLYPDALQYWGERWCRLSFLQQKRQRFFFTLTLTLSSIVFAAFRFTGLSVACVFVVLINFLRLLWMRVEGPIGWLWAILEAVVEFIVLSYVIIATARNKFQDAAIVLLLSLMRQFGFQREICAGERVRLATMMVLGITNVLFLILVCFAVTSFWEDEDWSAFGHAMNETKFYAIPTYSSNQSYTPLPLCRLRFPIGTELETPEQSSLSLADFGLMASLTYEPSSRVREGLRHYFPKWRLETKPESARYIDWVRFLMLTSEDNSTTVIAVRGTLDFLDALQDVSLWLVPALMQTLDFVGPDISSGAWGESVAELSTLVPLSMISAERSFSSVLAATEFMMKAFPERLFYITGHSLGGGVAKLVSLKLSATETTTIAFSAPGIRHAARVLFGEWAPQPKALDRGNSHGFARRLFRLLTRDLHKKLNQDSLSTITVKPEHDIISRIDLDQFMIKSHPERLFYLAGHSLGGGVAKLVALKLSAYAASPLTLAFSAPGIAHAARVMFGELPRALHDKLEEDEMSTLTVKPMHDIISRIDIDLGNSVVTPCEGRAWQCHSIYRTLWGIFKTLLCYMFLRMLWMHVEGQLGWLFAFLESIVNNTALACLLILTASKHGLKDFAVFVLLSFMRQFGYQRAISAGERVRVASTIILGTVHMLFVVLVCVALRSFWEEQAWSAFGTPMNATTFVSIPAEPAYDPSLPSQLPLCLVRFPYGHPPASKVKPPVLSLVDFALMVSLTYESADRAEEGCVHYFPGQWHIEARPDDARVEPWVDWVRFLMFTSQDNYTTVIAVRGTVTFVDVLQDVSLWLVPALMETMNMFGPDINSGSWGKSIATLSELIPTAHSAEENTFKSVLVATEFMMRS